MTIARDVGKSRNAVCAELKRAPKYQRRDGKTVRDYIRKGVFFRLEMVHLPRHGKQKRKYNHVRKVRRLPKGPSIEKRPGFINDRSEAGHWELDTVHGNNRKGEALLVLTERKSRRELIIKLPNLKSDSVVSALDNLERKLGTGKFKSITVDNGSEFAARPRKGARSPVPPSRAGRARVPRAAATPPPHANTWRRRGRVRSPHAARSGRTDAHAETHSAGGGDKPTRGGAARAVRFRFGVAKGWLNPPQSVSRELVPVNLTEIIRSLCEHIILCPLAIRNGYVVDCKVARTAQRDHVVCAVDTALRAGIQVVDIHHAGGIAEDTLEVISAKDTKFYLCVHFEHKGKRGQQRLEAHYASKAR